MQGVYLLHSVSKMGSIGWALRSTGIEQLTPAKPGLLRGQVNSRTGGWAAWQPKTTLG